MTLLSWVRPFVSLGVCMVLGLAGLSPALADKAYVPERGQSGKDVIWIPTPKGLLDKMLAAAKVTSSDRLFDLGAGDGIIAITAAKELGAQSVGIEYNPQMADYARRMVQEAGVSDKVRIITGDIFKEDFSSATVVTLYLLPDLNLRLRPTLLRMKPGTRVVSHAFTMGDWEADETMAHESARGYLWVVPASVEGEWMMTGMEGGPVRLNFQQVLQKIGGTLTRGASNMPMLGARLSGEELNFQFIMTPEREVHRFSGKVSGSLITGMVTSPGGLLTPVQARKR